MSSRRVGAIAFWVRLAGIALVACLVLLPVWSGSRPATQDGPSHVYNAALATWVRGGQAPFDSAFEIKTGVQPNAATQLGLSILGEHLGWPMAERVFVSVVLVASFLAILAMAQSEPLVTMIAAWFASSWFLWMGFYDFALSIPCFVLLLVVLRRPPGEARSLGILIALVLLYFSHVFTLAIGTGLAAFAIGADARAGRSAWRELWVVVPAMLALAIGVAGGGAGSGGMAWTEPMLARLADLGTGDFLTTLVDLDSAVGVIVILGVAIAVVSRLRPSGENARGLTAVETCGVALLLLSLLAPDSIGEGGYIPARMRILGALALFPAMVAALRRLSPIMTRTAAAVLLAVFAVRAGWLVREARAVDANRVLVQRLLADAGATEGAWIVSRLTVYRDWPSRVGVYRHLAEGVATSPASVVVNNYESLNDIFFVHWRTRPDWVSFRPAGDTLRAQLIPGRLAPRGPIFVLHERGRPISASGSTVAVLRTVEAGAFAVTALETQQKPGGFAASGPKLQPAIAR
jgi:hypothetical protein